ncbi:ABC transporter permease [Terribacillus saccharophilus]|uniref:ABC transporter permease n=1 Tax=Terribacillus saccharophilus TaxID=361277 RepID=A0A268A9B6_9BACI|nr:iron ABC transporter permease [Terribacillus saccharophilus]PAD20707.1 ABC transporter permease [Terribacillus saccharophilus]PAF35594.1 ABC transporter permease [Terribacillus saccharophilus]
MQLTMKSRQLDKGRHSALRKLPILVVILILFFFFLLPIVRLILMSFTYGESVSFGAYSEVLKESVTWKTLWNTIYIVLGSTVLSMILGITMAAIMAYTDVRGKAVMQLFIYLPFIIPSYITTLAWVQFFSSSGPLGGVPDWLIPNLYSVGGIIFVLGISHYPLVYLMTVQVFRRIPRDAELAAFVSGASRFTCWRKVIIPMALPGICSGALLAFLSNLDNFGVPAFLGIPANIRVLSTYIYEQVIGYGPSAFSRAAVLSVLLGIVAVAATLIQVWLLRRSKVTETTVADNEPRIQLPSSQRRILQTVLWIFLFGTSLVPFLAMGTVSLVQAYGIDLTWENLSLGNYRYILFEDEKVIRSLGNSLLLGLITAIVCLVFGTIFAYYRSHKQGIFPKVLEAIITMPYALPGTVLALCIILMWMQPLPGWYPGIYGTPAILLIAYITRFFVLQFRGSYTAFSQLDVRMEEAARTNGANLFTRWRQILLPLILPGVLSGALLVFLTSLTELTVSSMLWSSGAETVGVIIFSFEQAGYSTYSTAFSSLIVLTILLGGIAYLFVQRKWRQRGRKA